jgi:hypothetical protein
MQPFVVWFSREMCEEHTFIPIFIEFCDGYADAWVMGNVSATWRSGKLVLLRTVAVGCRCAEQTISIAANSWDIAVRPE